MERGVHKDNETLAKLAHNDQREREHFFKHPSLVTQHDRVRRRKVAKLLQKRRVRTARDFLRAALIFQHGLTVADYRKAQWLARSAVRKGGGSMARWLYAVATDRMLLRQGRRQKFGSQQSIVRERDPRTRRMRRVLRLLPYDRRTSDRARHEHELPSLRQMLASEGKPAPRRQKRIMFDQLI